MCWLKKIIRHITRHKGREQVTVNYFQIFGQLMKPSNSTLHVKAWKWINAGRACQFAEQAEGKFCKRTSPAHSFRALLCKIGVFLIQLHGKISREFGAWSFWRILQNNVLQFYRSLVLSNMKLLTFGRFCFAKFFFQSDNNQELKTRAFKQPNWPDKTRYVLKNTLQFCNCCVLKYPIGEFTPEKWS